MNNLDAKESLKENNELKLKKIDDLKNVMISILQVNKSLKNNFIDINELVDQAVKDGILDENDIYELQDNEDLFANWEEERDEIEKELAKNFCFNRAKKERRLEDIQLKLNRASNFIFNWLVKKINSKTANLNGFLNSDSWQQEVSSRSIQVLNNMTVEDFRERLEDSLEMEGENSKDEILIKTKEEKIKKIVIDLFFLGKINRDFLIKFIANNEKMPFKDKYNQCLDCL